MSSRGDEALLEDIVDRIIRISHAEKMLVAAEEIQGWEVAKTAFDAILYDLLVIGEVVKTLSEALKQGHSEIPWKEISGMRDILAHEYFRVSSSVVRATIDLPLSELLGVCRRALGQEN